MKTEAFICTSPDVTGTVENYGAGGGDPDPGRHPRGNAKAFDFDGVTDFSSDSIPPTKE